MCLTRSCCSRGVASPTRALTVYVCTPCRRESNRESARRSRMRKLEEIQQLEVKLCALQRDVDAQAAELATERGKHARASERLRGLQQQHAEVMQQARASLLLHPACWKTGARL
jgi:outer membrane murein-binding lipoprotein Lpp